MNIINTLAGAAFGIPWGFAIGRMGFSLQRDPGLTVFMAFTGGACFALALNILEMA